MKTSDKDVLKTSWKTKNCYTEDVLKTCLEDVLKTFLEDMLKTCLEDVLKTCLEDVLKTCLEDVLKKFLEDVLKTCLEDVLKTCLEDVLKVLWKQTKYLLGISVYLSRDNKSKCVSKKSIFHKSVSDNSKENPKCIN